MLKRRQNEGLQGECGMVTVEMVTVLPLFILFFVWIMSLIDAFIVQSKLQAAAAETAKEVATYATFREEDGRPSYRCLDWVEDLLGTAGHVNEKARDANLISYQSNQSEGVLRYCYRTLLEDSIPELDSYLERHGVVGGIEGISLRGSGISASGDVVIVVTYRVKTLNLPFLGADAFTQTITCSATTGAWGT